MSRDSSHPVSFHVMLSVSVAAPSHQHPSVFHLVSVLQQDAALAETLIVQDARGQAPAKWQRRAVQLQCWLCVWGFC